MPGEQEEEEQEEQEQFDTSYDVLAVAAGKNTALFQDNRPGVHSYLSGSRLGSY